MAEYNPSKIIKDGNTYNFRDTTKIPLSGSNQISGSLIPSTDNSIDIGSSTNNIKMLYTKGITINGTQFLPSDYATLSGLATVATSGNYNDLSNKPTIPTVNNATLTIQKNGTTVDTFTANSSSDKTVNIRCVDLNSNQTVGGNKEFTGTTTAHGLIPSVTNTYNLGTSTNKWKSFNEINPGALSLPSDTSITIDTTNFAWGRNFTFTPSVDGHLFINIGNTNGIKALSLKTGRGEYYFTNQTGILRFTTPVYKDTIVTILASSTGAETVIPSLSLFPCQGNV